MRFLLRCSTRLSAIMLGCAAIATCQTASYEDGRPAATLRIPARDSGVVLRHGGGPAECDRYGARDVWVFESGGAYYMHYDGAGPTGWLSALATSTDLVHWTKKGAILALGAPGEEDSASASYGTTYFDHGVWHMFYVGTPHASRPPNRIPVFPYLTMKAIGDGPAGPWHKQPNVVPFRPKPGSYDSVTASPGFIVKQGGQYLQFFSAATIENGKVLRTISLAQTRNLNGPWTVATEPILPLAEQIENTSMYYEKTIKTWFLFTDHIGIRNGQEYTDSVWVYWTRNLRHWNPANKAVVLDAHNCAWSKCTIGLPSVLKVNSRLAIFYDGIEGDGISNMHRDIGLAFLDLPLRIPARRKAK